MLPKIDLFPASNGLWVALAVTLLLFPGATGCESPTTQLVVLIHTDYAVPTEMGLVQVRVSDMDDQEISSSEFVLTDVVDPTDPTRFAVPLSFGIVPVGNDTNRRIVVEVDAMGGGGRLLSTRRAVTGFLSEQTLLLPMFITRACEDVVCPMEQTCTELGCISDVVDPDTLRPVDGGGELLDSGVMDSAIVDSGLDAPDTGDAGDSAIDAGADARVPLDCTAPCECAEGFCDVDCLMVSVCDVTCSGDGCAVTATAGREVSLVCASGASCSLDAERRGDVTVTCQDGSSCDVACHNSASCDVSCEGAASCLLVCDRVLPCGITTCASGAVTCAGGEQVCGRPCP